MKNRFTSVSILSCLLFWTACTFLDENPKDRLVTDNFYATAKDAQAAVDACYQQLNSIYNRSMYLMVDLPADGMKNGLGMPNAQLQSIEYLRHNPQNDFILGMWANNYSGIARANTVINRVPSITMNNELKERLIAEAKFLRALFYFNLVRFYGDVPKIVKLETINDAMGPRIAKDEIYQLIIQDLTDASILPYRSVYTNQEAGRATKGAAKILLAKVHLTRGAFEEAKNILKEVVDNESVYGYDLHTHYGDNWNTVTEGGVEAVFYLEYKKPPFPSNGEMSLTGPKYSIPGGSIGVSGSNEADIPTQELYDFYDDADQRRSVNMRFDYTNPTTGAILTSRIPLFGKFWIDGIKSAGDCDINMHVIRYADALLMYAEALNETNDLPKAITVLNRVRARAFGNNSGNLYPASKEDFKKCILLERHLEFPLEGHRWFDLVRTGTFVQRMKEHSAYEASKAESNKTEIANNIKEYMILYPIPQREMDLNPAFVNNNW